jgi:alcohol dehydrogenase (NADP+)
MALFAKFFDCMGPIPHHMHQGHEHAKLVGREGKPEAYYFPPQHNTIGNNFPYTFMGLEFGTTKEQATGGHTFGGYSDKIVVPEHFVIHVPPGADLAATAPLLCAGITTFSPMQHWKLARGQRVGVIGLGGLGHVAVKLAVARKADVTVFTTSPGKVADARRLGAREAVLWSDAAATKRLANQCDLLISTVPQAYPMQQFVNVLKLDATLVNVGAMEQFQGVNGIDLVLGRKSDVLPAHVQKAV